MSNIVADSQAHDDGLALGISSGRVSGSKTSPLAGKHYSDKRRSVRSNSRPTAMRPEPSLVGDELGTSKEVHHE